MTATPLDYAALARAVTARRVDQLGLTMVEVQAKGGPSVSTQTVIESGTPGGSYAPSTMAKLDRGLDWEPGSAVGVLMGKAPVPLSGRVVTLAPPNGEAHSFALRLADGTVWYIVGDAPMTEEREELLRSALGRRHGG
jgi:hypothetical protein